MFKTVSIESFFNGFNLRAHSQSVHFVWQHPPVVRHPLRAAWFQNKPPQTPLFTKPEVLERASVDSKFGFCSQWCFGSGDDNSPPPGPPANPTRPQRLIKHVILVREPVGAIRRPFFRTQPSLVWSWHHRGPACKSLESRPM